MTFTNTKLDESIKVGVGIKNLQIWVNGTTDKRYDLATNTFKHRSENRKVDIYHPAFMTLNVVDALRYARSHTNGDYHEQAGTPAAKKAFDAHAYVILTKLKPGIELFDFTDKNDYSKVGLPPDAYYLFGDYDAPYGGRELYVAFNTGINNTMKPYVPIEFTIAQKYIVYKYSSMRKRKPDGSVNTTFFTGSDGNSFVEIMFDGDRISDGHSIPRMSSADYTELQAFYAETFQDWTITKNEKGQPIYKRNDERNKVLPTTLSANQLRNVNTYLALFEVYAAKKSLIPRKAATDIYHELRANASGESRAGCCDLLQAAIHLAIISSGKFCGYYCPEFVGAEVNASSNTKRSPAVAIFDESYIDKTVALRASVIKRALDEADFDESTQMIALSDYVAFLDNVHHLVNKDRIGRKKAMYDGRYVIYYYWPANQLIRTNPQVEPKFIVKKTQFFNTTERDAISQFKNSYTSIGMALPNILYVLQLGSRNASYVPEELNTKIEQAEKDFANQLELARGQSKEQTKPTDSPSVQQAPAQQAPKSTAAPQIPRATLILNAKSKYDAMYEPKKLSTYSITIKIKDSQFMTFGNFGSLAEAQQELTDIILGKMPQAYVSSPFIVDNRNHLTQDNIVRVTQQNKYITNANLLLRSVEVNSLDKLVVRRQMPTMIYYRASDTAQWGQVKTEEVRSWYKRLILRKKI